MFNDSYITHYTCSGVIEVENNWTRIGCSISSHTMRPKRETFLDNLPSRDLLIQQQGFNISGKILGVPDWQENHMYISS